MEDLTESVNNLRAKYREIFKTSAKEIEKRVEELKPEGAGDIFDRYSSKSAGALWQTSVLKMFDEDICREIYRKWSEILAYRREFSCTGCGTC